MTQRITVAVLAEREANHHDQNGQEHRAIHHRINEAAEEAKERAAHIEGHIDRRFDEMKGTLNRCLTSRHLPAVGTKTKWSALIGAATVLLANLSALAAYWAEKVTG